MDLLHKAAQRRARLSWTVLPCHVRDYGVSAELVQGWHPVLLLSVPYTLCILSSGKLIYPHRKTKARSGGRFYRRIGSR